MDHAPELAHLYARLSDEQRAEYSHLWVCYGTVGLKQNEDGSVEVVHPADLPAKQSRRPLAVHHAVA